MYPEYAIGLMSGTSCDGIDCALVRLHAIDRVELVAFVSEPYTEELRGRLLHVAGNEPTSAAELLLLSSLLGELMLAACVKVCERADIPKSEIAFIASHGHTVQHLPQAHEYLGHSLRGTLQIGDVSCLNEYFGCPCVSDFRVRDFAAGGMGAPLVPFSEYLLYRSETQAVALQNIGGIGNITLIPKGASPEEVLAFDTGPGNMLLDLWCERKFGCRYDENGRIAAEGKANAALLDFLLNDDYYRSKPPKTSGREKYGAAFLQTIEDFAQKQKIHDRDVLNTLCLFTAKTIALSFAHIPRPNLLLIGGGGAHNQTMLSYIRALLPDVEVKTQDEYGFSADAKEAIAFALLGKAALLRMPSSIIGATGARHSSVLGKVQY